MERNATKRALQALSALSVAALGGAALSLSGQGPTAEPNLAAVQERAADRAQPSDEGAGPVAATASVTPAINKRFMPGEVFRYRYEHFANLTVDPLVDGQEPSGAPLEKQTTHLDTRLAVKIVASDETGYSLWVAFDDARLTHEIEAVVVPTAADQTDARPADPVAALPREIESRTIVASGLIDFDARGLVSDIQPVEAASPAEVQALRELASRLQWAEKQQAGASQWQGEEMDGLGPFQARYRPAPDFGPGALQKTLQYKRLHEEGFPSDARLVWAHGEFLADAVAPVTKGRGKRRAALQLPNEGVQLTIVESYTLELESRNFSDSVANLGRDGVLALRKQGAAGSMARVRPASSAREFGGNLNALMHHIENLLFSGEQDHENTLAAIDLLAEFLDEHPEQSASVLDWMEARADFSADDTREAVLINGLAKSGSPEAQGVLLEVASTGTWGPGNRSMAVLSVLNIENPVPDWETQLTALFEGNEPIGQIALQALGGATERYAHAGPEGAARRQQVMAQLRQHATNADPERRATALVALSNAAPETILPEIQSGLVDADEYVRSAAVLALSRVDDASVESTLLTFLQEDPSAVVRRDVISQVQERLGTDAVKPLVDRLHNDLSAEVRRAALGNLAHYPDPDGELKQAFEQVAANDPDPSLRQYADRVVNPKTAAEMNEPSSGQAEPSFDGSELERTSADRALPEFADGSSPFDAFDGHPVVKPASAGFDHDMEGRNWSTN